VPNYSIVYYCLHFRRRAASMETTRFRREREKAREKLKVSTIALQFLLYYAAWFCYVVFNSHMFNATEIQLWKWCFHLKFLLFMRPIHLWLSRTPNGVRCAHFPSVITTIMDQKVQLLKLTWVVYHVAEPYGLALFTNTPLKR
jgi:hypothetical protein